MKVKQVKTRKKEGAATGFRAARREQQSSSAAFNPIELLSRSAEEDYAQAELKVGSPGDIYGQEADRISEQVMSMAEPVAQRQIEEEEAIQARPLAEQITPLVQRQAEEEEEPIQEEILLQRQVEEEEESLQEKSLLQRQLEDEEEEEPIQEKLVLRRQVEEEEEPLQTKRSEESPPSVSSNIQDRIQSLKGGGRPLTESTRNFFEPRFGRDFSNVRVHTDSTAAQTVRAVQAKAFTVGNDVVFGSGQYSPETDTGKKLLAHELTHVAQRGFGDIILERREEKEDISEEAETIEKREEELAWSKTSKGLVEETIPGKQFLLMNYAIGGAKFKKEHEDCLTWNVLPAMAIDPMSKIRILGYASKTGSRKFNQKLSVKRAQNVEKYMRTGGLEYMIEEVSGKSFDEPIADNETVIGRARNRRVEIQIIPWKPTKPVPEILESLQKGVKPYVVRVDNFSSAPFQSTIKKIVEDAFSPIKLLKFNWEGKSSGDVIVFIEFDTTTRDPDVLGFSGTIYLRSFKENKICRVEGDPSTCEKVFPETAEIMGRAIANTVCHEIAEMMGLYHVSEVDNYLWTAAIHPLYRKKDKTYEEKLLLHRTLNVIPAKFNDSQIVKLVHIIKHKRSLPPGVYEF